MNVTDNSKRIGIFTFPLEESGIPPLDQLIIIVKEFYTKIILISGNSAILHFSNDPNILLNKVNHLSGRNLLSRIIKYIKTQMRIGLRIISNRSMVHTWISFIGSNSLIIPTICAKITGKKLIKIIAGSDSDAMKFQQDLMARIINIISTMTHILSDKIVIYSSNLIDEWDLTKFTNKIVIAPHHFIDFNMFFIKKPLVDRINVIGYVGRFSGEKGILNFIEAISIIPQELKLSFIIIGDGPQKSRVLHLLKKINNAKKIQNLNWIPHESLNNYLNEMKLLVIPSYSEGLPNIMLEAMAAGTPVLASRVGSIPGIIKNDYNGFLLQTNSPQEISDKIQEIIKKKDLLQVSTYANLLVKKLFNFKEVKRNYKKMFLDIEL